VEKGKKEVLESEVSGARGKVLERSERASAADDSPLATPLVLLCPRSVVVATVVAVAVTGMRGRAVALSR
jgi:hypothetical protein